MAAIIAVIVQICRDILQNMRLGIVHSKVRMAGGYSKRHVQKGSGPRQRAVVAEAAAAILTVRAIMQGCSALQAKQLG